LDDFHRFRRKAAMERFWAGVRGESLDLLPFDEVSSKLRAVSKTNLGVQQVPLANIIGSVNRTSDFDRDFRPLSDDDQNRWANVKTVMTSSKTQGVPPVSLYKIGDAYFVMDGNHRVSIANEMGMDSIEAYVTEVKTKVSLSSSFTLDELVEKAALADFLEDTHLDRILPGIDLSLKRIENYSLLKEHINVHQYYMGIEQNREVSFQEATVDWYDKIYTPVAEIIENSGLHQEYQDLTTTDLYLWVLDQQQILQEEIGTSIKTENVVDYVASQDGKETSKTGTTTDEEREIILTESEPQQPDCLFRDIMVSISESDSDWIALEQAMLVNRCSNGSILGIHVLSESSEQKEKDLLPDENEFSERISSRGMKGRLLTVSGDISKSLRDYSLLTDLMVLKLTFPPGGSVFDRLSSGIITLLQTSRRPVLFVKEDPLVVSNILLLYDEREKSREALFISAYYAARYGCSLSIGIPSKEGSASVKSMDFAHEYLSALGVQFESCFLDQEKIEQELPVLIEQKQFSTVIMGGYESGGLLDRIFASNVDKVLEIADVPVLVCQ
jgi:nucleotide-binding universal stress UspA family protein